MSGGRVGSCGGAVRDLERRFERSLERSLERGEGIGGSDGLGAAETAILGVVFEDGVPDWNLGMWAW